MIVPRMTLDGVTTLDSHRRSTPVDGAVGAFSPRPRSASVDGGTETLVPNEPPTHIGRYRSESLPLAAMAECADTGDMPGTSTWGLRGECYAAARLVSHAPVPGVLRVRDLRVQGRQLRDPRRPRRAHVPAVTAMASSLSGSSVAFGDESGHVFIVEEPRRGVGLAGGDFPVLGDAKRQGLPSAQDTTDGDDARYVAVAGMQAYGAVIDPLNSVEVTPAVAALSFLPRTGPCQLVLSANEKVPKLFKVFNAYDCPASLFSAVHLIGTRMIGPLVSSSRTHTNNVRTMHRYPMDHEYNINGIHATIDGSYFYTTDDLSVRLWSTELPDESIEVLTLPKTESSNGADSVRETIRSSKIFPQEPSLLFLSTSAGNVRICDTRESLRWSHRSAHLMLHNPQREELDGIYAAVTNAITGGCALSPCGRYVAARDFFSVPLWDMRKGGNVSGDGVVARWELHDGLRDHFESLYQSNLLFEKMSIAFSQSVSGSSSGCICTGSFGNAVYMMDPLKTPSSASDGVHMFSLPDNLDPNNEQDEMEVDGIEDPHFHEPFRMEATGVHNDASTLLNSRRVSHVIETPSGGIWAATGHTVIQLVL